MSECRTCWGCGQVADDDEATPWKFWLELPVGSAAAVIMGLVKPLPCPDCGGTGETTASPQEVLYVPRSDYDALAVRLAEVERQLAEANERAESNALAYIEASNPGIDMDDVRRIRAERKAAAVAALDTPEGQEQTDG